MLRKLEINNTRVSVSEPSRLLTPSTKNSRASALESEMTQVHERVTSLVVTALSAQFKYILRMLV